MLKRLPGDEPHRIVSTTPDTAVVFKPAVIETPAIITFIIHGWRFTVALGRTIWRHPVAVAIPIALGLLWFWYGWPLAAAALGVVVLALTAWAFIDRGSFARLVGWRLLAWWRLVSNCRRH